MSLSFSSRIVLGLASGVLVGLFFGERAAVLKVVADGFVRLLQMTVLPYVTISIISSLGSLSYEEAKRLGVKAGLVVVVLWVVALAFTFLFPLAFPPIETAAFFSTTLLHQAPPFDFVSLFIPSNPFHSLANNVVPAVVLFSVALGAALIGVERKEALLDVLGVVNKAISRATRFITGLMPYGIFAIAATAAGTLDLEQLEKIQVYLITYMAVALLVALWVLPGLVAALTPIGYREVLGPTRAALITAFITGDLFIVLPIITEACRGLLEGRRLTDAHTAALPDVIVPVSFNFPHTGKLLSISFVLFASWFTDAGLSPGDFPRVALVGLLTFFGSLNSAIPFMLDLFGIPADTFQLFLATGVINSRFGTLVAAVHTVAVALLGSAAIVGAVRFEPQRLLRYGVITAVLTAGVFGGLRTLFATTLPQEFAGAEIVYSMRPLVAHPEVQPVPLATAAQSQGEPAAGGVLAAIRARGALRVGILADRLPYAFPDRQGKLAGFDVEMAHRLAHDLQVSLVLVEIGTIDALPAALAAGHVDIAMSGLPVTPLRAAAVLFSAPYLDETLGFVVRDALRTSYSSWAAVRALGPARVAVPNLPYYVEVLKARAPGLTLEVMADVGAIERALAASGPDAMLLPAERGSVLTLLYPQYSVVVPEPGVVKVPLAYPVARRDQDWARFIDTWIELKKRDGTIDALYGHWILGRNAVERRPRWSIARNVLGWLD